MPILTRALAWLVSSWVGQYLIAKGLEVLAGFVRAWKLRREAQRRNEGIIQVSNELKEANSIDDQETRLKRKEELVEKLKALAIGARPPDAGDS